MAEAVFLPILVQVVLDLPIRLARQASITVPQREPVLILQPGLLIVQVGILGMAIAANQHLGQGQAVPTLLVAAQVLEPIMIILAAVVKLLSLILHRVLTSMVVLQAITGMAQSVWQEVMKVQVGQIVRLDPKLGVNLLRVVVALILTGIMAAVTVGHPALIVAAAGLHPVINARV